MSDHTNIRQFAAFVNVENKNKFWVNQHWVWDEDCPGLFRYDTKEDKERVNDVAQSYLNNWDMNKIELVIMEVKTRKEMLLTKNISIEEDEIVPEIPTKIKKKKKEEPLEIKTPDDILLSNIISDIPVKKTRGRPRKNAIMSS